MSTRGAVGMRYNGVEKVGYNHWDSYPSGLGISVLNWLKGKTLAKMKDIFKSIVAIKDDNYDNNLNDVWDGDNEKMNDTFRDTHDFLYDSLFCEFAYIVNLDDKTLEIYKGFNKSPGGKGRYADKFVDNLSGDRYYGVTLWLSIPLKEVFAGKWAVLTDVDRFVKG